MSDRHATPRFAAAGQNHDDFLEGFVASIVRSYESDARTRGVDGLHFTDRDAIIEIVPVLRELLFPGYFGKRKLSAKTVRYHVGHLAIHIEERLAEQVYRALAHRSKSAIVVDVKEARSTVRKFLETIPRLRELYATDIQAAFDGDPAAADTHEIVLSYPGFFAITIYRLAHELHKLDVPLIPRILTEHAHNVTGIDVGAGAVIDESFFIDHGTGVVIGETTTIGKRVKIYQGVTLGALSTRGGQRLRGVKRHPTLEDDVTVYSGASILGGETVIGQGVVISSNVFVTKSVPGHTRVTVKNPELQYRDQKPQEFKQELPYDWVI